MGRYVSYELNVVLRDAGRVNVVLYADVQRLRADAEVLSEFLGVPTWDVAKGTDRISMTEW